MLMDSDSGLNLVLGFDNSLQKVVTRTMLNQEEIFRNQVLELHRLYEIQKIIMKEDFKLNGGERPHSFVGSFSENFRYESLATEMKLSEVHMIGSSRSLKYHCLKEHRDALEHQQISLDLKLAGSQYTNDSENHFCDTKVSALTKHGIYNDEEFSIDVLELSLRADADTWHKCSGKRACNDKIICSPSLQVPAHGYATHSGAKNEFETSCSFISRKNDSFDWIPEYQSLRDGRANFSERKHFYQGVEQRHEELSCRNVSAKRKLFASHEVGELDLNKALPDESSVHQIDSWIFDPSRCTSSVVYGKDNTFTVLDTRQLKNNYSTESSALAGKDTTVSTLTISPSKDTGENLCKSTLCSVDFGSICGSLSDSKDHGNGSGNLNLRPKNAESEIFVPEKTCRRISMSELNVKRKKEDKLCSHYSSRELLEGTDSNRSPISCKSDLIVDDVSSNTKTGQRSTDMPNSNVGKKLVQQNVMMPSSETKSQPSDPEKEESTEVDPTVKKGAVSLMYFSLECLARNQDYSPKSRKRKESCNDEREVPQTSSESYESIVLKQQECSVDEYCVSSTPFEATGLDKNDHGVKLKRGRRMKDFRKEILPGLASLTRQEISEDVKIMELALRSREYKKYRSKTERRSECFSPVRSKRSRQRYVGRRYYS